MTPKKTSTISHPVAIIGMGCIFPESRNLKEYWHLLFNGIDAVQPIPEDSHWQLKDYFDSDPARPDHTYCTRGGFIPKIAFNPLSYGIPPNNIEATDTSQLLGLEVARMALADAGYPSGHPDLEQKKVNVILGVTGTQELVIPLGSRLGHPLWKKAMEETGIDKDKTCEVLERLDRSYVRWQENSFPGLLGNVVAGRIANRLNLSGTNAVSDAACASSLSAIHTAVMELQSGRCDMSITGGVDTLNDIFMHMCFSKTGVLSHSSDAKPFSKDADGTVLGEGIGMLVLKRLADAEKDKDRIYAVIKGVGTASDGRTSAVYAPEAKGQIKALKEAYERAGVNPASIGLIEAHGTGTRVGDKVEFTALKTLFGPSATPNSTAIGSVKSMIGHTKAAAGAAGMIKTALALHHKVIPPTLKADIPDPDLDINASAFYLNNSAKPWVFDTDKSHPRRSGVSAFGFGGSNFHVVLEEYQSEKNHVSWDGAVQIIALSAGDKEALSLRLRDLQKQMATFDSQDQAEYTQAIAWQAHESRQNFSSQDRFRLLILVTKEDDFARLMEEAKNTIEQDTDAGKPALKGPVFFGTDRPKGKLGFVFPGQGSQYTGMAKDIMAIFPEAMEALALGQSCLAGQARKTEDEKERTAPDLSRFIYPLPSHLIEKKEAEAALRQTDIAQPAIGSVSLAMTRILKGFNIAPDYTCGHSFGELSALYAAGWMDKTNFLSLSAARGRYMADAGKKGGDPGSMLAVQAPIEKIRSLIKDHDLDLVLANINSPLQGVLSGSTEEIDRAYGLCRKQKMRGIKLPVAAAFHSRLVENAARPFNTAVAEIPITPTQVQVVSNTTGRAYPGDEKEIKEILGHQLMHPVNFTENIQFMYDQGVSTFLEIGPKSVLTGLIRSILKDSPAIACALDGSGGKNKGMYDLGLALCTIAALGYPVDLGPWEEPAKAPEPKKMKLMLSGANQKSKREQLPPSRPAAAKVNLDTAPAPGSGIPAVQAAPEPPKPEFGSIPHSDNLKGIEHPSTQGRPMTLSPQSDTPSKERHPGLVPGSMDMLQRGLEAMQQLQAQTARAHEKFLETQAQAGRTLAGILEQSRSGALDAPGSGIPAVQPPPAPMAAPAPVAAPPVQPAPRAEYQNQEPVSEPPQAPVPETVPPQASEASAPLPSGNGIQKILFEIVSRLTGFPVEMLEPQMDIESDLGIDSIKKVEIISELEKAMDQGHALTPDHLSAVRTLEDICRAAGENGQKEDSRPEPEAAPQGNGAGTDRVFATLVEIISQLTGFPKEMLEPEMSLESDLGIDSIKRVEILSKLEQELADLPAISPDEMAGLKTIKDITQYLSPHGDRS